MKLESIFTGMTVATAFGYHPEWDEKTKLKALDVMMRDDFGTYSKDWITMCFQSLSKKAFSVHCEKKRGTSRKQYFLALIPILDINCRAFVRGGKEKVMDEIKVTA